MTLAQQVGAELRRIRNGRSQRELAKAAGCEQPSIKRLEAGEANPTLARLERIGAAYGVSFVLLAKATKKGEE